MWSETVSVINLQTLKQMLKSAQKCGILGLFLKFKNWGGAPFCVLSIRPL